LKTHEAALAALADPTRREIVEHLRRSPMPVGELAARLPVSRPAVSQHLKVLKDAGLVSEKRDGTRRVYNLELHGVVELRRYLDGFWDDVMRSLGNEAAAPAPASRAKRVVPLRPRAGIHSRREKGRR
jgi:DNA-binding transcriptional ArsR family regulator